MQIAKAEVVNQPVVRLTVELPPTHADELGGLLAHHVDWRDFPWAERVYSAIRSVDLRGADVFRDEQHGNNVFLQRKRS